MAIILTKSRLRRYGVAVLAVAIAVVLKLLLAPLIQEESPFLLFFLPIVVSAWYGGWGPGLLATALATLSSDFFFIAPAYSFTITSLSRGLRLVLFVIEGLSVSWLSAVLRAAKQRSEANALALHQSEERFRLLVESVQDYAIFALDPDGYIVSWNVGAERIKGYQPKDILGQHFSRFYQPKEIEQGKPERELQIAATEGRFEEEGWRVRKDGSLFWANVVITALRDETGKLRGFAKVTRDFTERQRVQEALRASEQQFRATFNQAAVGIAHVAPNGQWLLVNQKLCDIVGYTREELLERTFQDITYPADLNADLEYVRQILANEIQTYAMEKRYIRKDHSLVWINLTVSLVRNSSGDPNYFISVIEDINARKYAEAALRRSSARLETLHTIDQAILAAQSSAEIACAALSRMRQLISCQQACVVLFNFERGEARILATSMNRGMEPPEGTIVPIANFVPHEVLRQQGPSRYIKDIATLEYRPPILERRLSEGMHSLIAVSLLVETELIGELNLLANQPAAFNQEDKEIAYEVANQLAIAIQQARLREQLQSYAAELEQRVIERTAALQEANTELEAFTYSVSHDLRAPLRAMQGFAQALLEDYPDRLDALGQDYAQRIVSAASRMDTLINELLAYSRLSRAELHLRPLSLTTAVEEALAQVEAEIQEKHALMRVEEPLLDVIGHRTTLVQVVANLLTNAIKFVAPGIQPQVRIWTEELPQAQEHRSTGAREYSTYYLLPSAELRSKPTTYHSLAPSNWVRLWIEDNGIGIAPQYQQRIFRVFERLHGVDSYPGTGIGLAIARKGVERMGGRVGVESQTGQGSRFWIELPKALTDR